MRIIKNSGTSAWKSRNGKMHGSTAERALSKAQGKLMRMGEKPYRNGGRPPARKWGK